MSDDSLFRIILVPVVLVIGVVLLRVLGKVRVGSRRSSEQHQVESGHGYTTFEHEAGLIQQWYTDQPCQRIYSIVLSATMSVHGLALLGDEGHVQRAVRTLTVKHPVLRTTIARHPESGRAAVRIVNVDNSVSNEQHPLGAMPVSYVSRHNDGSWQDAVQQLTHKDMDEAKWLFRFAIVMNKDKSKVKSKENAAQVEIVFIVHHFINDGLSSATLLKDFVQLLGVDHTQQKPFKLTPMTYFPLDQVVDLRPPLSTVFTGLMEDLAPAFLRPKPDFWQGPVPKTPVDKTEGHFATVTFPALVFQKLKKVAKAHNVSVHGILTSVSMVAEAEMMRKHYSNDVKADGSVNLKFYCPMGRAVRQVCGISLDQVGVFVMTAEEVYTLPAAATMNNHTFMWELAAQVTELGKQDIRHNLDYLGLLNFLPRDSITTWFVRDGSRYVLSRNSSIEISNLGAMTGLDNLIKQDTNVSELFALDSLDKMQVYMPLGRAYRGPVLAAGVATTQDNLSMSISCQLGQCGCQTGYQSGEFCKVVDEDKVVKSSSKGRVICSCPNEGLLHEYSHLVHNMLLAISDLQ